MKFSKIFILYLLISAFFTNNTAAQFLIPKTKIAPAIDGQMESVWDYAARDSVQNIYSGEAPPSSLEDFSIEFRLLWDDDNIYLLAIVTDDIINTSNGEFYYNDVIQIFIDGGNEKNSGTYDNNDVQLSYVYNDNSLTSVYDFGSGQNFTLDDFSNCQFASAEINNGYLYEIALSGIDIANKLGVSLEAGYQIGFDIIITDNDSGDRDHLLLWHSPGDVNFWENPSVWGTLTMSNIIVEQKLMLTPKTYTNPIIDGMIDDIWQYAARDSVLHCWQYRTPPSSLSDFSAEFRILWNDNNLYLLVIVMDDIINTSNTQWWENDAIQIYIDGGNERNIDYDENDLRFTYTLNDPGITDVYNPNTSTNFAISDFSNCQFTSASSSNGYIYEILLSGTDLSNHLQLNLNDQAEFGMDIILQDNDSGVTDHVLLWNNPGNNDYWLNPCYWGTTKLTNIIAESEVMLIPKTPVMPTIDGDMEDVWYFAARDSLKRLQLGTGFSPDSPEDFSGEYRILWDDNNIYLFISVNDDIVNTNNPAYWFNDMVQLFIDGNNDKNSEYDNNDVLFSYVYNDDGLTDVGSFNSSYNYETNDFSNCQFVSKATNNGYNYEILLSGLDLNSQFGLSLKSGREFGWNISITDNDTDNRDHYLSWSGPYGSLVWEEPNHWGTAIVTDLKAGPREIFIPKTSVAPTIDGDMDEIWHTANVESINQLYDIKDNPEGPEDFSGEFRMLWDDDNLYLFVSVTDDIYNISHSYDYRNDAIQFFIDGNNEKTPEYDENDLLFCCKATENVLNSIYSTLYMQNFDESDFSNCQFISKETDSGYHYEILLSGSDLSAQLNLNLTVNNVFGWNVAIMDNDDGDLNHSFKWLCPYGKYMWNDPSLWGTATLAEIIYEYSASTGEATNVTQNSATIHGTIVPNNQSTSVSFEYGETSSFGNSVAANPATVNGTDPVNVSANITGLKTNQQYFFRVVAQNPSGTIYGEEKTFTTTDRPFVAQTDNVTDLTYTTAVLNGTVNSDGLNMDVFFDYGESTTYGNRVTANPAQVSNTENNTVSAEIGKLYVGATYHYRVVLTNDTYTIYGEDNTFTTETYPTEISLSHTIDFTRRSKGNDYKPEEYRIIGLPGGNDEMIATIFSGKQDEDWQVYWDNGKETDYLVEYNGDNIFRQIPGRAFWILNKGSLEINQPNKPTASLNNNGEVEIEIHPGWNLITNPFHVPVAWDEVRNINGFNTDLPLWAFDGGWNNTYIVMKPFEGYYFDNPNVNETILKILFKPVPVTIPKLTSENQFDWKVNISVTANHNTDDCAYFGVHKKALKTRDEFEYRRPRALGDILSVYFDHPNWDTPAGAFNCDIRPPVEDIEEWQFTTLIPGQNEARFLFTGIEDIPNEFSIFLINDSKGNYINLRENHSFNYLPETNFTSFTVVVGKENLVQDRLTEVIPKEFSLRQNYPNPFNPSTTIPFALPIDAYVTIKVYNILGEEVCVLLSKNLETGKHNVHWDGVDKNGNPVTSGIYIYQMTTDSGKRFSGKMMLLK
jgi:hypothetical protein